MLSLFGPFWLRDLWHNENGYGVFIDCVPCMRKWHVVAEDFPTLQRRILYVLRHEC